LTVSLEDLVNRFNNEKALVFSKTLDEATAAFLENNKSPSRKVGELDNRGSHYYLAMYWAQALAAQNDSEALKASFTAIAGELKNKEEIILKELNEVQGVAVNIGGYYRPDSELAEKAMRPSETFNKALSLIK
jgi:isocitrate dehydrogenase